MPRIVPKDRYEIGSSWIGLKLRLNPQRIKLFIDTLFADPSFKNYKLPPIESRRKRAECVHYLDPVKRDIFFGPEYIIYKNQRFENCGYNSLNFRKFVEDLRRES